MSRPERHAELLATYRVRSPRRGEHHFNDVRYTRREDAAAARLAWIDHQLAQEFT